MLQSLFGLGRQSKQRKKTANLQTTDVATSLQNKVSLVEKRYALQALRVTFVVRCAVRAVLVSQRVRARRVEVVHKKIDAQTQEARGCVKKNDKEGTESLERIYTTSSSISHMVFVGRVSPWI